jgi:hypothetical protein
MASAELSAYELERLEHIKRNHEQLVRLGLVSADSKPLMHFKEPKTAAPHKRQKKMMPSIAPESLRRSSRVAKLKPEYNEEKINNFGDDDREVGHASRAKGKKRSLEPESDSGGEDSDSGDDEHAEILASTTAFLQAAREALLQFVSSHDGQAPSTSDGWRAEAIKRWGEHCGQERDWETFVTSRLSKPPPPSPHDLLQEYYVRLPPAHELRGSHRRARPPCLHKPRGSHRRALLASAPSDLFEVSLDPSPPLRRPPTCGSCCAAASSCRASRHGRPSTGASPGSSKRSRRRPSSSSRL